MMERSAGGETREKATPVCSETSEGPEGGEQSVFAGGGG